MATRRRIRAAASTRNSPATLFRDLYVPANKAWQNYWIGLLGPTPPKPPRTEEALVRVINGIKEIRLALEDLKVRPVRRRLRGR